MTDSIAVAGECSPPAFFGQPKVRTGFKPQGWPTPPALPPPYRGGLLRPSRSRTAALHLEPHTGHHLLPLLATVAIP